MQTMQLLFVVMVLLATQSAALPGYFLARHSKTCADYPLVGYKYHGSPMVDSKVAFATYNTSKAAKKDSLLTKYCSGDTIKVMVTFPTMEQRLALIVATYNTTTNVITTVNKKPKTTLTSTLLPSGNITMIMPSDISDSKLKCSNRFKLDYPINSFSFYYTIPCPGKTESMMAKKMAIIKVISAAGSSDYYHTSTLSLPLTTCPKMCK